jgi:hypothetical protein
MIYSATITTAVGRSQSNPLRTELRITKGLVYKVELDFPPGSAGLLGAAIFDGGFQVWPSTLGQWFTGDGIVISFDDTYLKEAEPFLFDVVTFNDDDTYAHKLTIRIGLVSKEIFMARFLPSMQYDRFEELIEKLITQQAEAAAEQQAEGEPTPYEILFGT